MGAYVVIHYYVTLTGFVYKRVSCPCSAPLDEVYHPLQENKLQAYNQFFSLHEGDYSCQQTKLRIINGLDWYVDRPYFDLLHSIHSAGRKVALAAD